MVRKHPKNNFSAQVHESQFIEQKPFSIKNISGKPENLDIKSSNYTSQKINKYDYRSKFYNPCCLYGNTIALGQNFPIF
jgi:hypothetical protein